LRHEAAESLVSGRLETGRGNHGFWLGLPMMHIKAAKASVVLASM
jgi:hypothetical protein